MSTHPRTIHFKLSLFELGFGYRGSPQLSSIVAHSCQKVNSILQQRNNMGINLPITIFAMKTLRLPKVKNFMLE